MKHLLPANYCPDNRLDYFSFVPFTVALEVSQSGECVGIYLFEFGGFEISLADIPVFMQRQIENFAHARYQAMPEGA